ncbi:MAG: protein-L-isoaspartate O-methyltransferase [Pseudomonadota bacterium]
MTGFQSARQMMVDCQVRPSDVTRYALIDAMLRIPREQFVPRAKRDVAYAEIEVEVSDGRALLSPRIFAKMVEAAGVREGDLVLELCPATGYSTAVLAAVAEMVVAIEPDETLAQQAQSSLDRLSINNAVVTSGDPVEGDEAHAPFDLVFVNGAVEMVPASLSAQLKDGGRMVALVSDGSTCSCRTFTRTGDAISERFMFDGYGPLLNGFSREAEFSL